MSASVEYLFAPHIVLANAFARKQGWRSLKPSLGKAASEKTRELGWID
jgi:hypothetical protein